jgi:transportin-1
VALEACEFWLVIAENEQARGALSAHLTTLVPLLLSRMRYSEEDLLTMPDVADDDAHVPDRPEDIRPRFHHARSHRQVCQGSAAPSDHTTWTGGEVIDGPQAQAAARAAAAMNDSGSASGSGAAPGGSEDVQADDGDDGDEDDEEEDDEDDDDDDVYSEWSLRKVGPAWLRGRGV